MKRNLVIILTVFIFLLAGCSEKTPTTPVTSEKVLAEVEKVHKDVESVFVKQEILNPLEEQLNYKVIEQHDFANERYLYEIEDEGIYLYKDQDEMLIVMDGQQVDPKLELYDFQAFKIAYEIESQKNPFKQLKKFDENLYENFTVKEREKSYLFTYNGSDEERLEIVQGIIWSNHIHSNALVDSYKELELTDVELEITASTNKKTNHIELFKIFIKYTSPDDLNNKVVENSTVHKYSKYNEVENIKKPAFVAYDSIPEPDLEKITFSPDEVAKYEKEASEYVDALIQATVFQNIEQYVKRVPGFQTEEEKRKDASTQQSMFRAIYEQNTMKNMEGTGVTEEQVSDYASAFLKAISMTTYEVTDAKMQADDTIKVGLSVRGINDSFINYEVGEVLATEYEAGDIEEADILNRNIELIIEAYHANDRLMNPSDAFVDVIISEDGKYRVFFQDQYLQKFVQ